MASAVEEGDYQVDLEGATATVHVDRDMSYAELEEVARMIEEAGDGRRKSDAPLRQ